jgi:hypothetical protein
MNVCYDLLAYTPLHPFLLFPVFTRSLFVLSSRTTFTTHFIASSNYHPKLHPPLFYPVLEIIHTPPILLILMYLTSYQ